MKKYFYDLHIHSCLSPCADDDMTPENIAGMLKIKGVSVAAVCDHNSCENVPAFFAACEKYGIVPIAGMEFSTAEDIHLVCLFEDMESAVMFSKEVKNHLMKIKNRPDIFGNQIIMGEDDRAEGTEETLLISATDLWMKDALELARAHGAHVHPAHIDRQANGIISILGDIPAEYGFDTVEFADIGNTAAYSAKYPAVPKAVKLFCSDAHRLFDISEADNYVLLSETSADGIRKEFFEKLKSGEGASFGGNL